MTGPEALTRFGFLRHAETRWNREGRIQGRCDSPLTREGEAAAARWGEILAGMGFTRILTSGLPRASRTAKIINQTLNLPLSSDPDLNEQDFGDWEGRAFGEIEAEDPQAFQQNLARGWDFRPPNGEPRKQVAARAFKALARAAAARPGENILVVAHETVIKAAIYRILGRTFLPTEPKILKKGRLHILRMTPQGPEIETLNAVKLKGV